MTKPNYTELIVVLDRSGSMDTIRKDMEGGFNRFIEDQKKVPGECRVSLFQFDDPDKYEEVYVGKPLNEVPKLELVPRGMTALYDAVAKSIVATGDRFQRMAEHERPDKVVFIVITDGEENSSVEWSRHKGGAERVRSMVTHQEQAYSWVFVYLGSNLTTHVEAVKIGIVRNNVAYTPSSKGANVMYAALSESVSSYRSSASRGVESFAIASSVRTEDDLMGQLAEQLPVPTPHKPTPEEIKDLMDKLKAGTP